MAHETASLRTGESRVSDVVTTEGVRPMTHTFQHLVELPSFHHTQHTAQYCAAQYITIIQYSMLLCAVVGGLACGRPWYRTVQYSTGDGLHYVGKNTIPCNIGTVQYTLLRLAGCTGLEIRVQYGLIQGNA